MALYTKISSEFQLLIDVRTAPPAAMQSIAAAAAAMQQSMAPSTDAAR